MIRMTYMTYLYTGCISLPRYDPYRLVMKKSVTGQTHRTLIKKHVMTNTDLTKQHHLAILIFEVTTAFVDPSAKGRPVVCKFNDRYWVLALNSSFYGVNIRLEMYVTV